MPRKKEILKRNDGGHTPRIRENSRLMHTHESIVDVINGRHPGTSFLEAFVEKFTISLYILKRGEFSTLEGYDFFRNFGGNLHNDIIYSDDDDDDDDDDLFFPSNAAHRPLQPHPRIRQLTDEEAEKHAKELIAEEERRKEKTERNKRKKMRKKEKKRLEKENAVKVLPEEEQGKSDSSDNQDEIPIIESKADEYPKSSKTQNAAEAAGCDESSGNNKNERVVETKKKEDVEQKDLDLNNSYASAAKSVPEETCNQNPAIERKVEKSKLLDVQQHKEVMLNIVEKPEVQKKKDEKPETTKEQKTVDTTAEEYAKRSRELANIGNRLAASGQYEMAVKCFTDAIKFNPKEFKLFGNRSLCYERMQQYENAFRDADLALCMEPNWIKGLFRKGKALCGLKKYYEASLIYKEVLKLDSSSAEAIQELKRAQTLHLMEMGFTWAESSEALKTHATLEQAIEALFGGDSKPGPRDASKDNVDQPMMQGGDEAEGHWTVLHTCRPRMQQVRESDALGHSRSKSNSPTPHSRNFGKPELFPVWVGSLSPTVTYTTLHELFSRVGVVYGIKMLLEHQCAFVNYTRKEDCDRAIQCFNGMVVEGAPLSVRYPLKIHSSLGASKSAAIDSRHSSYKKECFFWRTTGCTRQDCTYRHVPEHKNIDKDKFTSRLGQINM